MGNTFELCHASSNDTYEGDLPRGKAQSVKKVNQPDTTKSTSSSSLFATFGRSSSKKTLQKDQVQKRWTQFKHEPNHFLDESSSEHSHLSEEPLAVNMMNVQQDNVINNLPLDPLKSKEEEVNKSHSSSKTQDRSLNNIHPETVAQAFEEPAEDVVINVEPLKKKKSRKLMIEENKKIKRLLEQEGDQSINDSDTDNNSEDEELNNKAFFNKMLTKKRSEQTIAKNRQKVFASKQFNLQKVYYKNITDQEEKEKIQVEPIILAELYAELQEMQKSIEKEYESPSLSKQTKIIQTIKSILDSENESIYLSNIDSDINSAFKPKMNANGQMFKIFSGAVTTDNEGGITVHEDSSTDNNDDFRFLVSNLGQRKKQGSINQQKFEQFFQNTVVIPQEILTPRQDLDKSLSNEDKKDEPKELAIVYEECPKQETATKCEVTQNTFQSPTREITPPTSSIAKCSKWSLKRSNECNSDALGSSTRSSFKFYNDIVNEEFSGVQGAFISKKKKDQRKKKSKHQVIDDAINLQKSENLNQQLDSHYQEQKQIEV